MILDGRSWHVKRTDRPHRAARRPPAPAQYPRAPYRIARPEVTDRKRERARERGSTESCHRRVTSLLCRAARLVGVKDELDAELNRILDRLGVRRERPEEAAAAPAVSITTTTDLFAAVDQVRRDTLDALLPHVRPEALARLRAVLAGLDYHQPRALLRQEERAVLALQVLALVLSLVYPRR
jgi:hypothetical protein